MEPDPDVIAELKAWDIYHKASLEARVMSQLCHDHVLGLIGITLQPLRLLVELAPMGDLKACVMKFKKAKVQLSRRTITTTLIQVGPSIFVGDYVNQLCVIVYIECHYWPSKPLHKVLQMM